MGGPWKNERAQRDLWQIWARLADRHSNPYECDLEHETDSAMAPPTHEFILCTDASYKGLGWSWFRWREGIFEDPHGRSCLGRPLCEEEKAEHIFFLELKAALEGLAAWKLAHPEERVTLVTDNAAVAFALRQGFSSNVRACKMIEEANGLLECTEDIILVLSADNPADCCSRNRRRAWREGVFDTLSHSTPTQAGEGRRIAEWSARAERVCRCVSARSRGWNWGSETRASWSSRQDHTTSSLRHEAPPDECIDELLVTPEEAE